MKKVNDESLVEIIGGTSTVINGSFVNAFVNAFVNVIKLLMDAGISVGSSIRRIAEGEVCPLQ